MIKRMKNTNEEFYGYMGPIFGSREVQRKTSDRFYDDDGKEWVLDIRDGKILSVVSIKGNELKNVYSEDELSLELILKRIRPEVAKGTVPITYREAYVAAGYLVIEEKKNFLVLQGGRENG